MFLLSLGMPRSSSSYHNIWGFIVDTHNMLCVNHVSAFEKLEEAPLSLRGPNGPPQNTIQPFIKMAEIEKVLYILHLGRLIFAYPITSIINGFELYVWV